MSVLSQMKKFTKIVADTGDFKLINKYKPIDSTTNPSLILKAAQDKNYEDIIVNTIKNNKNKSLSEIMDNISVNFGVEILKIIPGRVSTEVDARLSFDTEKTIDKAREIIELYKKNNIDKDRVLIKIASTYEGIKACNILEKEGIHCNMTLLFSLIQAIGCAEVGATLISPFVGRILDWYKKSKSVDSIEPSEDPGVLSVIDIYNYYKKFEYKTEVMGASFRNSGEIIELAGCDLLTISPNLLEELRNMDMKIHRKLDSKEAQTMNIEKLVFNEVNFRWMLNENAMATEKLSEGIRKFTADIRTLEKYVQNKIG